MNTVTTRILLAEDDRLLSKAASAAPRRRGFEVLTHLKADPQVAGIPVVMLSNLGQQSDVDEALRAGAADYWIKADLRDAQLVAKVATLLEGLQGKA